MREWLIWLWNAPRMLLRQILALDDTDHSKALGVAIGMFIGMTPTVGIQMAMVMVVALLTSRLFYFNRVAAILTVYISNPFTMLPLYWMNYKIGTWFVAGDVTREEFAKALEYNGWAEWWDCIIRLFVTIGTPLIVGSLVVATVLGVLSYPLMRWLLKWLPHGRPIVTNRPETASAEVARNETSPAPVTTSSESKP